jgi:uncharacterized protein (TIGR02118 family)
MSATIVVLYPHPKDSARFEEAYVNHHLPLMRRLLGPEVPLPTYRALGTTEQPAAFYRMAEIHFETMAQLVEFASSEQAELARASSRDVSTGGSPLVFVCERHP